MPTPPPAPSPVDWGYYDLGTAESAGGLGPTSWEYKVWVRWSSHETTSKTVNIPRPGAGSDVDVNGKVWAVIHSLIREGTTFRHPDADLPTDPELPDPSSPVPYGQPEARTPDPDDPLDPSPPERPSRGPDTPRAAGSVRRTGPRLRTRRTSDR